MTLRFLPPLPWPAWISNRSVSGSFDESAALRMNGGSDEIAWAKSVSMDEDYTLFAQACMV
ncbi:hypothetical protein [Leisingera sp. M523]|uniref:hypothetical protein n=1 Tax=Leisingera sp. M523 TaxID=2867013 RepID=UPI0021A2F593|nr:hypothetical protein [Leisingera sp. M523]UWQ28134.1 hypothetical protein K3557_15330 [Leisingera sp. M523]